jgi:hypothetical protein
MEIIAAIAVFYLHAPRSAPVFAPQTLTRSTFIDIHALFFRRPGDSTRKGFPFFLRLFRSRERFFYRRRQASQTFRASPGARH